MLGTDRAVARGPVKAKNFERNCNVDQEKFLQGIFYPLYFYNVMLHT